MDTFIEHFRRRRDNDETSDYGSTGSTQWDRQSMTSYASSATSGRGSLTNETRSVASGRSGVRPPPSVRSATPSIRPPPPSSVRSAPPSYSRPPPSLRSLAPSNRSAPLSVRSESSSVCSELSSVRSRLPSTCSVASSVRSELSSVRSRLPSACSTASSVRSEMSSVRSRLPSTCSTASSVRSEMSSVRSRLPSTFSTASTVRSETPSTRSRQPSVRSEASTIRSEASSVRSGRPSVRSERPSVRSREPSVRSGTLSHWSDTSSVRSGTLSVFSAPPSYRSGPPSYRSGPPSYRSAPPSYRSAPPSYRSVSPSSRTFDFEENLPSNDNDYSTEPLPEERFEEHVPEPKTRFVFGPRLWSHQVPSWSNQEPHNTLRPIAPRKPVDESHKKEAMEAAKLFDPLTLLFSSEKPEQKMDTRESEKTEEEKKPDVSEFVPKTSEQVQEFERQRWERICAARKQAEEFREQQRQRPPKKSKVRDALKSTANRFKSFFGPKNKEKTVPVPLEPMSNEEASKVAERILDDVTGNTTEEWMEKGKMPVPESEDVIVYPVTLRPRTPRKREDNDEDEREQQPRKKKNLSRIIEVQQEEEEEKNEESNEKEEDDTEVHPFILNGPRMTNAEEEAELLHSQVFLLDATDIEQTGTVGEEMSEAAVYRLIYDRVQQFNANVADDADRVALLHPRFVREIFEQHEQHQISPVVIENSLFNNIAFGNDETTRYLIPVLRDRHFVVAHVGYNQQQVPTVTIMDSLFSNNPIFSDDQARVITDHLLPSEFMRTRNGISIQRATPDNIPLQDSNGCGIETVLNAETLLQSGSDLQALQPRGGSDDHRQRLANELRDIRINDHDQELILMTEEEIADLRAQQRRARRSSQKRSRSRGRSSSRGPRKTPRKEQPKECDSDDDIEIIAVFPPRQPRQMAEREPERKKKTKKCDGRKRRSTPERLSQLKPRLRMEVKEELIEEEMEVEEIRASNDDNLSVGIADLSLDDEEIVQVDDYEDSDGNDEMEDDEEEEEVDHSGEKPKIKDQEAQDRYQELPLLPRPEERTRPPKRRYNGCCVFCQQEKSPHPWEPKNILPDNPMRCGHVDGNKKQCRIVFHPSCISVAQPMPEFDAQYYGLPVNFGAIVCPDHVCERCHTDGYMQSAKQGELEKVKTRLRSFHKECRPVGAVVLEDGMLKLPNTKNKPAFTGVHCTACSVCGKNAGRGGNKCETCVQTTHPRCGTGRGQKKCFGCVNDERIEYEQPVLVEEDKYFRVGKCVPWSEAKKDPKIKKDTNFQKDGFVAVRMENGGKIVIKDLEEVQRVRPDLANATFHTISETYQPMDAEKREAETDALRNALQTRVEEIKDANPPAKFVSRYKFHSSLLRNPVYGHAIPELARISRIDPVHPAIKIVDTPGKGRGVIATQNIRAGTRIVEYVGEIISDEEHAKRAQLGDRSKDHQELEYTFGSSIYVKEGETWIEIPVAVESSVHHNIGGFVNSSCDPNCDTFEEMGPIVMGNVRLNRLIIIATKAIPAGTEITIDYRWKNFLCLCGTPACRNRKVCDKW